ncbi:hypothetical protein ACFVVM_32845 [Nocardia sp. NPDC058176]|uniref:hypothetical protein n=1 Tax=Nocardia sp. NPDC058176 TaxID=3346368 RepID=UPI0036DABFD2
MATTTKGTKAKSGKAKRMTEAEEWEFVKGKVRDNAAELKAMTRPKELLDWAKSNGLDTGWLFKKFKAELRKQLYLDYDELRATALEKAKQEIAEHAAAGPLITLWSAGDAEVDSYAICAENGDVAWYNTFYDDDKVDDQTSADIAAAQKAIWLAGKVREEVGADAARLALTVSNHEVQAADPKLATAAVKAHLVVEIEISDDVNPALEWCQTPGFQRWQEFRLTDAITDETGNEVED